MSFWPQPGPGPKASRSSNLCPSISFHQPQHLDQRLSSCGKCLSCIYLMSGHPFPLVGTGRHTRTCPWFPGVRFLIGMPPEPNDDLISVCLVETEKVAPILRCWWGSVEAGSVLGHNLIAGDEMRHGWVSGKAIRTEWMEQDLRINLSFRQMYRYAVCRNPSALCAACNSHSAKAPASYVANLTGRQCQG